MNNALNLENTARRIWLKSMGAGGLILAVGQAGNVFAQTAAAAEPV